MPTIAQLKQQVDRIRVASFQTDVTDTLASHLRRHALAGVQAALETALVHWSKVKVCRRLSSPDLHFSPACVDWRYARKIQTQEKQCPAYACDPARPHQAAQ